MDTVNALIFVALTAWILQMVLGFFQLKSFNRMLQELSRKGVVRIGRTASRWRPRTLVVLVHDAEGVILDARLMKGISTFTRPKPLTALLHASLPLSEQDVTRLSPSIREAIACALSTK